jgi:hypothetical protein
MEALEAVEVNNLSGEIHEFEFGITSQPRVISRRNRSV